MNNEKKCRACFLIEEINRGKLISGGHGISGEVRQNPSAVDKGVAFLLEKQCTCKKENSTEAVRKACTYCEGTGSQTEHTESPYPHSYTKKCNSCDGNGFRWV